MRNNLSLILVVVSILLCGIVEHASGSIVTFGFGGELIQVGGPNGLAVGDPFTGTFSYSLEQTGTNEPLDQGQGMKYVFDSYSLTIQGQTVTATGRILEVWNNSVFGDRFHLIADDTTPSGFVTGSINGAFAKQLFLFLGGTDSPFMDTSLPTALNLEDFPDPRRIDVAFTEGSGAVIGEITNLSVVPVPAASWLFMSGLSGLALLWVSRQKMHSFFR